MDVIPSPHLHCPPRPPRPARCPGPHTCATESRWTRRCEVQPLLRPGEAGRAGGWCPTDLRGRRPDVQRPCPSSTSTHHAQVGGYVRHRAVVVLSLVCALAATLADGGTVVPNHPPANLSLFGSTYSDAVVTFISSPLVELGYTLDWAVRDACFQLNAQQSNGTASFTCSPLVLSVNASSCLDNVTQSCTSADSAAVVSVLQVQFPLDVMQAFFLPWSVPPGPVPLTANRTILANTTAVSTGSRSCVPTSSFDNSTRTMVATLCGLSTFALGGFASNNSGSSGTGGAPATTSPPQTYLRLFGYVLLNESTYTAAVNVAALLVAVLLLANVATAACCCCCNKWRAWRCCACCVRCQQCAARACCACKRRGNSRAPSTVRGTEPHSGGTGPEAAAASQLTPASRLHERSPSVASLDSDGSRHTPRTGGLRALIARTPSTRQLSLASILPDEPEVRVDVDPVDGGSEATAARTGEVVHTPVTIRGTAVTAPSTSRARSRAASSSTLRGRGTPAGRSTVVASEAGTPKSATPHEPVLFPRVPNPFAEPEAGTRVEPHAARQAVLESRHRLLPALLSPRTTARILAWRPGPPPPPPDADTRECFADMPPLPPGKVLGWNANGMTASEGTQKMREAEAARRHAEATLDAVERMRHQLELDVRASRMAKADASRVVTKAAAAEAAAQSRLLAAQEGHARAVPKLEEAATKRLHAEAHYSTQVGTTVEMQKRQQAAAQAKAELEAVAQAEAGARAQLQQLRQTSALRKALAEDAAKAAERRRQQLEEEARTAAADAGRANGEYLSAYHERCEAERRAFKATLQCDTAIRTANTEVSRSNSERVATTEELDSVSGVVEHCRLQLAQGRARLQELRRQCDAAAGERTRANTSAQEAAAEAGALHSQVFTTEELALQVQQQHTSLATELARQAEARRVAEEAAADAARVAAKLEEERDSAARARAADESLTDEDVHEKVVVVGRVLQLEQAARRVVTAALQQWAAFHARAREEAAMREEDALAHAIVQDELTRMLQEVTVSTAVPSASPAKRPIAAPVRSDRGAIVLKPSPTARTLRTPDRAPKPAVRSTVSITFDDTSSSESDGLP